LSRIFRYFGSARKNTTNVGDDDCLSKLIPNESRWNAPHVAAFGVAVSAHPPREFGVVAGSGWREDCDASTPG